MKQSSRGFVQRRMRMRLDKLVQVSWKSIIVTENDCIYGSVDCVFVAAAAWCGEWGRWWSPRDEEEVEEEEEEEGWWRMYECEEMDKGVEEEDSREEWGVG